MLCGDKDSLHLSKQICRSLFENSQDALFIADADTGIICEVNRQAENLTGFSAATLIGMHQSKLHPPELADMYRERFRTRAVAGKVISDDLLIQHKDGHIIAVNVSASRLELGAKVLIAGVFRDVSGRKREQQGLAVLVEASRSIHETLDEQQIVVKLVNYARRLVDCDSGTVGLYHDGKIYFREYIKTGEVIPVEFNFPPGYGVPGHVLETGKAYISADALCDPHVIPEIQQQLGFFKLIDTPIIDAKGNVLGCFEMHDRIDGEDFDKQDLAMLQSLSSIASAALQNTKLLEQREHVREQLSSVNRTLRMISDCNQALVRATDEATLLATICQLIVNEGGYVMAWVGEVIEDDEKCVLPVAQAGFEDDYLQTVKISWADNELGQGPTGRAIRERHYVVSQNIVRDPGFRPWREQALKQGYAASVAFPLVVDKKVVAALNIYAAQANTFHDEEIVLLKELAGDLAFGLEVLRHRQAELAMEAQFRQAQKMEAVGTLAGGIAHDFNNMLAGMLGTVFLVRKQLDAYPQAQEKLKRVETTGFRAAEVISQLLTFAHKGETHLQPLALTPFLKEAIKMVRSGVPENIQLTLDVPASQCTVNGDATLLHQVLLNLVSNSSHAVRACAQPEIHITLAVLQPDEQWLKQHSALQQDCYARLTVADNGCGIRAEILEKLFDPFFTTKKVGEGTGLGLAMAYGAIQSHHGVIEVDSTEGQGSAFHLWLPLTEASSLETPVTEEQLSPSQGETILLADDESAICEVTQELLESMGYHVLIAADGEQALALFNDQQAQIKLAVLDVVMPRLGGVETAHQLRRLAPELPIVFQTGYGEDQIQQAMPRSCVLTKPVNIPQLSRVIRQLLDASR